MVAVIRVNTGAGQSWNRRSGTGRKGTHAEHGGGWCGRVWLLINRLSDRKE